MPNMTPRGSKSGGTNGITIPWDGKLLLGTTPTGTPRTPRTSANAATPSAFYNNGWATPRDSNSAAKFRGWREKVLTGRNKTNSQTSSKLQ